MARFLLVAHSPLASAMLTVAQHAFPEYADQMAGVDVLPDDDLPRAQIRIRMALQALVHDTQGLAAHDVLVLVDVFGATPCTAAMAACDGLPTRIVTGLSVPMLWRVLCYADKPLDDLVNRALLGASQGAIHATVTRRQNQNAPPAAHDQDDHHHQ